MIFLEVNLIFSFLNKKFVLRIFLKIKTNEKIFKSVMFVTLWKMSQNAFSISCGFRLYDL